MYNFTASIVLYQSPVTVAQKAIDSFINIDDTKKLLILIDHSPTDILKDQLTVQHPNILYFHHPENKGYGAGHNIAIRKIIDSSPIHYIINPDVRFEKDVIPHLNSVINSHQEIGMIMPKITDQYGHIQHLAKLLPSPIDVIGKRFLPKKWMEKRLNKYQLKFTSYEHIMNVPYLSGCFMCIKTSGLKKIGLFDERYFMYPEDVDLTRRMHVHYDTIYYPKVSIIHEHEAASYKSFKMLYIHIINMMKYFNKWGWVIDKERDKINKATLKRVKGL